MQALATDSNTATTNPTDLTQKDIKETSASIAKQNKPDNKQSYIMHVPQGRTARLTRASLQTGISGLYTDGFSSCNIIIYIGADKISLTHLDDRTSQTNALADEMKWMGNNYEVVIIAREIGKPLTDKIMAAHPSAKLTVKKVDEQTNGLLVSFEPDKSNLAPHPNVKPFSLGNTPPYLLRHPQEQKFTTCYKTGELFGLVTGQCLSNQRVIFDETGWEQMDDVDLEIPQLSAIAPNEKCLEYFNFIKEGNTFMDINGRVQGVMADIKKTSGAHIWGGDTKEASFDTTYYSEDYIGRYNLDAIFVRNIQDLLTARSKQKTTSEDHAFEKQLTAALKDEKFAFANIKNIITSDKAAPLSPYKDAMLQEIRFFSGHYIQREEYKKIAVLYQQKTKKIEQLSAQAIKAFQAKDYNAAINLFSDCLNECRLCCTKSDPGLASTTYSLGRSYFMAGQYEQAKIFLQQALFFQENYVKDNASLVKVKKALVECVAKLPAPTSASQPKAQLAFTH